MSQVRFAACMAVGLMAVTPVFAQSMSDGSKPADQTTAQPQSGGAADSSMAKKKQGTQGVPAGSLPPQYGKQHTQGAPAGTTPPQYGMKQRTQGVPTGTLPPQYGKQHTQGVVTGTTPTQYGMKQHTQGVPAGTIPPQYGAEAGTKQQ